MFDSTSSKKFPFEKDLSLNDIGFQEFQETIEDYESFISVLSHDFASPIRHIKEFSKLLRQSMQHLGEDQGLYFDYIEKSLKRLEQMQDALMQIMDITPSSYQKSDVSMQEILEETVKKIDFSDYKVNPVISCEPLPIIKASPDLMRTLMFHLIDNACRYSPDNGEQTVFIKAQDDNKHITFEVRDNGIGIDNEFTKVVFNVFRRLHNQDEYGGGIGAGLTICKKIVEAHGGKIWINSKLDKGSSVFFILGE